MVFGDFRRKAQHQPCGDQADHDPDHVRDQIVNVGIPADPVEPLGDLDQPAERGQQYEYAHA